MQLLDSSPAFDHEQTQITPPSDSLKLRVSDLKLAEARLEVTETNFLHRLIPQVHCTASIGLRDAFFADPSTNALTLLPRDAYRLTFTLSLTDLVDRSKHRAAELKLDRLQLEIEQESQHRRDARSNLRREHSALEDQRALIGQELSMKEDVCRYDSLRFVQGKIGYEILIRSKLDVVTVKIAIKHLENQIREIRYNLRDGIHP